MRKVPAALFVSRVNPAETPCLLIVRPSGVSIDVGGFPSTPAAQLGSGPRGANRERPIRRFDPFRRQVLGRQNALRGAGKRDG